MWIKKNKENITKKPFGILSSCGFKRITSILLVLCLVALPVFALPNKAGLFQRMAMTSQDNSQTTSSNSSNQANGEVVISQEQQEMILMKLDELSENSILQESENGMQADFTETLQKATAMYVEVNKNLNLELAEKEKVIAKQEGQIEELRGDKVQKFFEVGGTYNLVNGWGAGANVGLKVGHMTTRVGVQVPVENLLNPPSLTNLTIYTFTGSVGFQW